MEESEEELKSLLMKVKWEIAGYKGKGQNRSKSKKSHVDFSRTEFQRGDLR